MLLHVKYLYGIRVEVRGAHHFPPSQPYVVVSNHQSSLDLLGETPFLGTCRPYWHFATTCSFKGPQLLSFGMLLPCSLLRLFFSRVCLP